MSPSHPTHQIGAATSTLVVKRLTTGDAPLRAKREKYTGHIQNNRLASDNYDSHLGVTRFERHRNPCRITAGARGRARGESKSVEDARLELHTHAPDTHIFMSLHTYTPIHTYPRIRLHIYIYMTTCTRAHSDTPLHICIYMTTIMRARSHTPLHT